MRYQILLAFAAAFGCSCGGQSAAVEDEDSGVTDAGPVELPWSTEELAAPCTPVTYVDPSEADLREGTPAHPTLWHVVLPISVPPELTLSPEEGGLPYGPERGRILREHYLAMQRCIVVEMLELGGTFLESTIANSVVFDGSRDVALRLATRSDVRYVTHDFVVSDD